MTLNRGHYATVSQQMHATTEAIHRLRLDVGSGPGAREMALAATKIDEARLWLNEAHDALTRAGVFSALCPCGAVALVDCKGCERQQARR